MGKAPRPVIPGGLSVREAAARDRHQMLPDEHAGQYRMQILHIARIPSKASTRDDPRAWPGTGVPPGHRRGPPRTYWSARASRGISGHFSRAAGPAGAGPREPPGAGGEVCVTVRPPARRPLPRGRPRRTAGWSRAAPARAARELIGNFHYNSASSLEPGGSAGVDSGGGRTAASGPGREGHAPGPAGTERGDHHEAAAHPGLSDWRGSGHGTGWLRLGLELGLRLGRDDHPVVLRRRLRHRPGQQHDQVLGRDRGRLPPGQPQHHGERADRELDRLPQQGPDPGAEQAVPGHPGRGHRTAVRPEPPALLRPAGAVPRGTAQPDADLPQGRPVPGHRLRHPVHHEHPGAVLQQEDLRQGRDLVTAQDLGSAPRRCRSDQGQGLHRLRHAARQRGSAG